MAICKFCGIDNINHCKSPKRAELCEYNQQETNKSVDAVPEFDFGFNFVDDNSENETKLQSDKEDLVKRLDDLYNAMIPFLDNLCSNPDKPTIHWPNRVQKINEYKERLLSIKEGR